MPTLAPYDRIEPWFPRVVYAVYAAQQKVLRIMVAGFVLQVAIIAVSLGVSMPKMVAGFYCQAADLPTEMVLYRCVDPSLPSAVACRRAGYRATMHDVHHSVPPFAR